MDADERARIDELAEELIQLVYRSGETIFIAAGLNGSEDVDAVLLVTSDPPRAKQLEQLFEVVSRDWELMREERRGERPDGGRGPRRRDRKGGRRGGGNRGSQGIDPDGFGPGPGSGLLGWN